MDQSEHNDYTLLFAQRQEQLYVEQIRKNIDLEVRLQMISGKYEKAKNELDSISEMFKQAKVSIETLTNTNAHYNNKLSALEPEYEKLLKLKDDIAKQLNTTNEKLINAERELARQNVELQNLYNENVDLKKTTINKKKAKNDSNVIEATEENTF
jgi:chromosome segregation ATPase